MKKNFLFLAILLFMGGVFFTSCEKDEELSDKKEILSFVFEASKNANLENNVYCTISGTDIIAELPFGTNPNNLIPSIEVSADANVNPGSELSMDFSNPVNYTVTAEDGSTKTFSINVPVAPAPFIGIWETESSVNISNLGLSRLKLSFTEEGQMIMELRSTISGKLYGQSIKGLIDPNSVCNTEILVNQTHRWLDDQWTSENAEHCIMYYCSEGKMEFKYCINNPKDQWWFVVSLVNTE